MTFILIGEPGKKKVLQSGGLTMSEKELIEADKKKLDQKIEQLKKKVSKARE